MVPPYFRQNRGDREALHAIRHAPERVLVADDEGAAQLVMPLYFKKTLFLADTPPLGQDLGALLQGANVPGVLLVSRGRNTEAISLAPYRLASAESYGRLIVQRWTR
jgi:hypothetical protein